MSERGRAVVRAPEFPAGMEWLNVPRPLTLAGLRGQVVLLDFWTFCCINCMHVLPELRTLEERFEEELTVIGVHCAKFPAESDVWNLRQAVLRYDIRHPVVSDPSFRIWRAYAARAWPTLVLVSPDGYVIGQHSGEFRAEALAETIEAVIREYDAAGKLVRGPLALAPERHREPERPLAFPGKVQVDRSGSRLFVADTEHHRICEVDAYSGELLRTFGCGEPGMRDGDGRTARFRSPQGITVRDDLLYVADTGNHALRRVALASGTVTTLAGNGRQASPYPREGLSRQAELNSPWDVAYAEGQLYVAMAGSHQIWRVDLRRETLSLYAGSGVEGLGEGPRLEARLAQPSGLAVDGERLWFVDSESSSLRWLPLLEQLPPGGGEVRTALGLGLFEFGDVDGGRSVARLQHPLGVACAQGKIFLADSYNHRIKVYDPVAGEVRCLSGSGEPGLEDGPAEAACFWEPGGLAAGDACLWAADTNNHALRRISLPEGEVVTLTVVE